MAPQYKLIHIYCDEALSDLLIAEMSVIGYDSFINETHGFTASIPFSRFDKNILESIFHNYQSLGIIQYETEDQDEENWNEIWEKNYSPVIINDRCLIRASYHDPDNRYPMEIVIDPKMSFGTGHHETTQLMILNQFESDHQDKMVLDVGCGTGILSIVAGKLGAMRVTGIDIDPWSFQNALENIQMNHSGSIEILNGDISKLPDQTKFDILLANLNRQIILGSIKSYHCLLYKDGLLICSGFLIEDKEKVKCEALRNGFSYIREKTMNKWSSLVFQKKTN